MKRLLKCGLRVECIVDYLTDEIDQQHREMEDIERHIRDMENDIVKLNALLYKQTSTGMFLEQTNILSENDFVKGLRVSYTKVEIGL